MSFSVGNYTRTIDTQIDPFDQRVMAIKNDDASNLEDTFENWPAERVKIAAEGFAREDQRQQDIATTKQNADIFLAGHPEVLDTQANGELFNHELSRMFPGVALHPIEHFEQAYASLRASNFLALNKAEVAKQQKAANKQLYDAERAQSVTPSEDALYQMDMQELRMRADGVIR
jgi:hypothetical protein